MSSQTTSLRPTFQDISAVTGVDVLGPGGIETAYTSREDLLAVVLEMRARGFKDLALLTAMEPVPTADQRLEGESAEAGSETSDTSPKGVEMVYGLLRRNDNTTVILKVALSDPDLKVPTLSELWSGAAALEREVYDLFGVEFEGHQCLTRIVLRDDFVGHPLRKDFEMHEDGVSSEEAIAASLSHGDSPHPEVEGTPFASAAMVGDPVLHSERLILNMGPQHPSTHGVLHVWIALDGEQVVAAEPSHGYLHRCIEKICEASSYRACNAFMDRCDYVSGFHTELAYTLALEELLGIESTPKADYLRVILSELVRITSHHTWLAAAGLDTGALTPFLYAFIDREKINDFMEAIAGSRMMFNYFRPGGVRDDLQPEVAKELAEYLRNFDKAMEDCEGLLTENEIFRSRTRGIGIIPPNVIRDYCVTGPMARASGVDIDLRRDEPYAAYDRIPTRVTLGESGDTFDRYTVRIAEMHEAARIALEALEGLPEGPHLSEGVPRVLRPPAGSAYRKVESSRGELGVFLVSDGSAQPWRLKVRSPAFSNLHSSPYALKGCRVGDLVAILGSVDVVMGEIDR